MNVRRIAVQLGLAVASLVFVFPGQAQGNETVEFRQVNARHLTGQVIDINGEGITGAVVEDCDPTFNHVLASTTTDINGRFSFPQAKRRTVHSLTVRCPSFDLVHTPVKLRFFARAGVLIKLVVAT
jgi:hypothetical protein